MGYIELGTRTSVEAQMTIAIASASTISLFSLHTTHDIAVSNTIQFALILCSGWRSPVRLHNAIAGNFARKPIDTSSISTLKMFPVSNGEWLMQHQRIFYCFTARSIVHFRALPRDDAESAKHSNISNITTATAQLSATQHTILKYIKIQNNNLVQTQTISVCLTAEQLKCKIQCFMSNFIVLRRQMSFWCVTNEWSVCWVYLTAVHSPCTVI